MSKIQQIPRFNSHPLLLLIQSRLVRNEMVYFYWTNRRDAINTNNLQKEQIINHFAKAGSFATKVCLYVVITSYSNCCLLLRPPSIFVFCSSGGVVCEPEEPALV